MNAGNRQMDWPDTLARTARAFVIGMAATAGVFTLAAVVLWDADFYAARDRWENFKIAMFGEWSPAGKNIERRESALKAHQSPLRRLFESGTSVVVFREAAIEGTALNVVTGESFESEDGLLEGKASRRWCYVSSGSAPVTIRVQLATQTGDEPPVYANLSDIHSTEISAVPLSVPRMEALALTHCRFGV